MANGKRLRTNTFCTTVTTHFLGKAIWVAYEQKGGTNETAENFKVIAGQGVSAAVDGKTILAGKEDFMKGQGISTESCASPAKAELDQGATVVYIAADQQPIGFISLRDTVREDANKTLEKLKAVGITSMLLTGDNRQAAGAIAAGVGISDVRANLLPEEKMNIIKGYAGGALWHNCGSVFVVVNAALLLRLKDTDSGN